MDLFLHVKVTLNKWMMKSYFYTKYTIMRSVNIDLDVLIKNGLIVDGSGNPWFKADVGVDGERIVKMGNLRDERADRVIDATGLIVAPGFIELHSHSDYLFLADPMAEIKLMQGVTTDVSGNCGLSSAPIGDHWIVFPPSSKFSENFTVVPLDRAKEIANSWGIDLDWTTFGEYLERVEAKGISINHCSLIGHFALRATVTGEVNDTRVSDVELEEMKELLAQGMEEGAFGFSTEHGMHVGVKFEEDEVIELCKVARKYGGVFSDDIGDFSSNFLGSVKKAINTCEAAGIPTIIAHLLVMGKENWGKVDTALRLVEEARASGLQVVCDMMPTASSGRARDMGRLLPRWAIKGGAEELVKRLRDPETRGKIKDEMKKGISNKWFKPGRYPLTADSFWDDTIYVVFCEGNRDYEGKTISEISKMMGVDSHDVILNLMLEEEGNVKWFQQWVNDEDLCKIMRHPSTIGFGGDGTVGARVLESEWRDDPLHYGAIPRLLGKYVRDLKALRMEDAIRKLTSAPAQFLGIRDRGLLKEGMYADITIFDANTIADKTKQYEIPSKPTEGIEYVLVNGKIVIDNGKHTKLLPGKIIRHDPET